MLTLFLALVVGLIGGVTASGLIGWRLLRRSMCEPSCRHGSLDPSVEQRINELSREWAASHGRSAAAPLVANKLRLVYSLNRRRAGHKNRRWSR
jgi:hypothetical protein